jgi:HEAT repeat protein
MQQSKAQKNDPSILRDEAMDPVERAAALSRLVSDHRREFEPDIAGLLTHRDPILRGESVFALVGRWRIERYGMQARQLLTDDPDWSVRSSVAHALSMYVRSGRVTPEERVSILRLLALTVQEDRDANVQQAAYEGILRILGRPSKDYFYEMRAFDSQQDVNWVLLAPYLREADNEK